MSTQRILGVVGAGNMGSGIAQKMATEGFDVLLVDLSTEALERGMTSIQQTLAEAVERRIMKQEAADTIAARIQGTTDFADLSRTELVVEAVFENLEVKQDVFRKLSDACGPDTILATNTSSFFVRDIASVVQHPERVIGLHYFYHPAKNRLVEVVPTEFSSDDALARATLIQEAMGKTPITCLDAPGFVVNRYFVPWINEAVRLLEEGIADIPSIEAAAKERFRIGMGPFELMNVTGVPIAMHAANTLGEQLGPFYAPADRLCQQVESGNLWDLTGDVSTENAQVVGDRLSGVVFFIAGRIVDEGVGAIEDVDIGARVGLRWAKGPFELMNRAGVGASVEMAKAIATAWDLELPTCLSEQADSGEPFSFCLVDTNIADGIATLMINRPDAMNAVNTDVIAQLTETFDRVDADTSVNAIVIAGRGKGFIAGADIRFFVKNIESDNVDRIRTFTEAGQNLLRRFGSSNKVIIARLDGLSLGGGSEIALACDWIVATEKGSLGFPETGIGIYPGLGGTQRLPRRVGKAMARYLILSGAHVSATDALSFSLVDAVVPHEALPTTIAEFATRGKRVREETPVGKAVGRYAAVSEAFDNQSLDELLAGAPDSTDDKDLARAYKSLKRKAPIALHISDDLIEGGTEVPLADGLAMELDHLEEIFATTDALTGLRSLGGAPPVFEGA